MNKKLILYVVVVVAVLALGTATTIISDATSTFEKINATSYIYAGHQLFIQSSSSHAMLILDPQLAPKDAYIKFKNDTAEAYWLFLDTSQDRLIINHRGTTTNVLQFGYDNTPSYAYFAGTVSAETLIDRTSAPSAKKDVLENLRTSKGMATDCGKDVCPMDKSKLPAYLTETTCDTETGVCETGRDLTTTVSELWLQNQKQQELIDDLVERVVALER